MTKICIVVSERQNYILIRYMLKSFREMVAGAFCAWKQQIVSYGPLAVTQ